MELSRAISAPHERQRTAIRFGLEARRKLADRAETDTEVGRQPGAVRGVSEFEGWPGRASSPVQKKSLPWP